MQRLIFIFMFIPFVLLAQKQQALKDEIAKGIDRERMVKTNQPITEDTTLSEVAKIMYKKGAFSKELDKDAIRRMLREQRIYDYNIDLVTIPVKHTKRGDKIKLENKKLRSILKDTNYTNYGMVFSGNTDTVGFLFIERYFKIGYSICTWDWRYKKTSLVVFLETKSDTAIFYEQIIEPGQISNKRNGSIIKHDKVDIQVPGFDKKQYHLYFKKNSGDIVFYNRNGKILAYIDNHE